MQEVIPGIFQLSRWWDQADLGSNVYLIDAGGELALVDAGFKGKELLIVERVRDLGYSASRIASIIITHHHTDHTGGLAGLLEITGARVIAHAADAAYIDGRLPQPGPSRPRWLSRAARPFQHLLATRPVKVDIEVADGDELPLAGGIRILHAPGHTPGSICILLRRNGVVFTGDLLAQRFGLKWPSIPFTVDVEQLRRSVKKLAGHEFESACFGHGSPIKVDAGRRIRRFAGLSSSARE
ncbi:MAG: MBL fold metallo-hydrolase [Dehalococcoidia bacterium]|nr:MBL fold metallo-hydrolase [Dehalococcoidia bacterium]MDD5647493.1 MBL fold metallo-hydrolase [Dehalococcoidia bacterium]